MAAIKDFGIVQKRIGFLTLAKRVWQQLGEDECFTWGAAMAYSWMFAIFPFMVFLLSLVPLLPDQTKVNLGADISEFITTSLPGPGGEVIKTQVENVMKKEKATGFLSFGLILTMWAASGGMAMTMSAMDKAYDIEKRRAYYKQRPLAILLTFIVATLIILVMILLPVGTGVLKWLHSQGTVFSWFLNLVNVIRYVLAMLLMFTVLAIIYHFGPSIRPKFHAITPGAIFCVTVWVLLGFVFRLYLTKFGGAASYDKTYGTVAGAAVLLLLFYLDAVVLLVGAEINSEIDHELAKAV